MKRLTGEEFFSRKHAVEWSEKNAERMSKEKKVLNDIAMKQMAQAEEMK